MASYAFEPSRRSGRSPPPSSRYYDPPAQTTTSSRRGRDPYYDPPPRERRHSPPAPSQARPSRHHASSPSPPLRRAKSTHHERQQPRTAAAGAGAGLYRDDPPVTTRRRSPSPKRPAAVGRQRSHSLDLPRERHHRPSKREGRQRYAGEEDGHDLGGGAYRTATRPSEREAAAAAYPTARGHAEEDSRRGRRRRSPSASPPRRAGQRYAGEPQAEYARRPRDVERGTAAAAAGVGGAGYHGSSRPGPRSSSFSPDRGHYPPRSSRRLSPHPTSTPTATASGKPPRRSKSTAEAPRKIKGGAQRALAYRPPPRLRAAGEAAFAAGAAEALKMRQSGGGATWGERGTRLATAAVGAAAMAAIKGDGGKQAKKDAMGNAVGDALRRR